MQLGREHIGKRIQYWDGTEEGIFKGRLPAFPDDEDNSVVVLRKDNGEITFHGCADCAMGPKAWHLVDPNAKLPESIEPLMKEFGCHEKQTRALVAAILKEVKGA